MVHGIITLMIKIGSTWMVNVDKFDAGKIGGRRFTEPIPKSSILKIIDPGRLPQYPSDDPDPPARVRFSFIGADYWTFEREFRDACKPDSNRPHY